MNRTDIYEEREACPLYTAIGVIEGRWKPMIYQRLRVRPHGLGELRRAMPRITTRVLKAQLRELEADGITSRREFTHPRLGVRFQITPYGRTLGPVFEVLWRWGRKHLNRAPPTLGTRISSPAPRALAVDPEASRRG